MYMFRGLAVAACISIALALIISMFPMLESDFLVNSSIYSESERPVIQMGKPPRLDKEKLVSFLKQIPLTHPYQRVNIEKNALFIDLQTGNNSNPESIYRDASQIVLDAFTRTTNVTHTYLRFILNEQESQVLLLAVMSERDTEKTDDMEQDIQEMNPKQFLEKYAQVIYGTGWSK